MHIARTSDLFLICSIFPCLLHYAAFICSILSSLMYCAFPISYFQCFVFTLGHSSAQRLPCASIYVFPSAASLSPDIVSFHGCHERHYVGLIINFPQDFHLRLLMAGLLYFFFRTCNLHRFFWHSSYQTHSYIASSGSPLFPSPSTFVRLPSSPALCQYTNTLLRTHAARGVHQCSK